MTKLKVKVLKKFRDKMEEMKVREPGETLTVNDERGKDLICLGLAQEMQERKRKNVAE